MMIGEIDYGSIVVEAKDQHNEETGAPLTPIPEFSAAIICLFCVMVSVILMNLLVSVRCKCIYHGVENTANQSESRYILDGITPNLILIIRCACHINCAGHCIFYAAVCRGSYT